MSFCNKQNIYQSHYLNLAKLMISYYESDDAKGTLTCGCLTAQKNYNNRLKFIKTIKEYIKMKKKISTFNCLTLHNMFMELKKFDDNIFCDCKDKSPAPSTSGLYDR
uniref:PIR Superfamily Protein n=1 Tax=Strongyloides papillosus TaxID=174720 RepID=A0A0N5C1G6_STREA